jgi:hypothetical protein
MPVLKRYGLYMRIDGLPHARGGAAKHACWTLRRVVLPVWPNGLVEWVCAGQLMAAFHS